jgi:hypothetical protein
MAFAVFPAVVDQSGLVCGQVRSQFDQTLANLSTTVDRPESASAFNASGSSVDRQDFPP